MKIKHQACGPLANQSEALALDYLKSRLLGGLTIGHWRLLTNLNLAGGGQRLPDELDMVAIGASGIHLIEVKHWDRLSFKSLAKTSLCENEAHKLNQKAKRLAGRIKQRIVKCFFPLPTISQL